MVSLYSCNIYFQFPCLNGIVINLISTFSLHASMSFVVKQLQLLWSEKMIRLMFADLLIYVEIDAEKANKNPSPSKSRSP